MQLVLCYEAGLGVHAAGKDWIRVLTAVRRSFVTRDIAGKQGCHFVIFDAIVTMVISAYCDIMCIASLSKMITHF